MRRFWLLLMAVALAGCGGDKKVELVGTWAGTVTMSEEALTAELEEATSASGGMSFTKDQIKAMIDALKCSLTLNEDGTYSMTALTATQGGKWSFDSTKVGLSPETFNGLPMAQAAAQLKLSPMETSHMSDPVWLLFSEDGKTISGDLGAGSGYAVSFTKP